MILLIYLFIFGCAGSFLLCFPRLFSSCDEQGPLSSSGHGLLIIAASFVADHRSRVHRLQWLQHVGSAVAAPGPQSTDSEAAAHGLSWSTAWGIFSDQGSSPDVSCIDRQILQHWATREAKCYLFVVFLIIYILTENAFCIIWDDISLWFWFVFSWWLVMLSIFSCNHWPFMSSLETCLLILTLI